MNILSNVCYAWFCRSTHPFQFFIVSDIGQHGCVQPSLSLHDKTPKENTAYIIPSKFKPMHLKYSNYMHPGEVKTTLSGKQTFARPRIHLTG